MQSSGKGSFVGAVWRGGVAAEQGSTGQAPKMLPGRRAPPDCGRSSPRLLHRLQQGLRGAWDRAGVRASARPATSVACQGRCAVGGMCISSCTKSSSAHQTRPGTSSLTLAPSTSMPANQTWQAAPRMHPPTHLGTLKVGAHHLVAVHPHLLKQRLLRASGAWLACEDAQQAGGQLAQHRARSPQKLLLGEHAQPSPAQLGGGGPEPAAGVCAAAAHLLALQPF